MNRWVSFRQIKEAVRLGEVLEHYGWKCLRRRGDHVQGRCALHQGQRADTFHADLRNQGFHCFRCQAHGSVLDLVAAMERCSLHQAALWLAEWSGADQRAWRLEAAIGSGQRPERIRKKESSAPLRFSLRPIDTGHAYLKERGIEVETAAHFGVGYYAGPGLLHGRVVIPIHNEHAQLLAYA